jgi:hypothetical protein
VPDASPLDSGRPLTQPHTRLLRPAAPVARLDDRVAQPRLDLGARDGLVAALEALRPALAGERQLEDARRLLVDQEQNADLGMTVPQLLALADELQRLAGGWLPAALHRLGAPDARALARECALAAQERWSDLDSRLFGLSAVLLRALGGVARLPGGRPAVPRLMAGVVARCKAAVFDRTHFARVFERLREGANKGKLLAVERLTPDEREVMRLLDDLRVDGLYEALYDENFSGGDAEAALAQSAAAPDDDARDYLTPDADFALQLLGTDGDDL